MAKRKAIICNLAQWRGSQEARPRSAKPLFAGSSPAHASKIVNNKGAGKFVHNLNKDYWASGGMAYTKDLKSFGLRAMRVQLPPCPCRIFIGNLCFDILYNLKGRLAQPG